MVLASLLARLRSWSRRPVRRAAAPRSRPALEPLEDRTLCAVVANPAVIPAPNPDPVWVAREKVVAHHTKGRPNVVFLGDSIFDRFQHGPGTKVWKQDIAPLGARDFAVAGSTTQNVLWMIDQGLLAHVRPRVVVLLIGTNNLNVTSKETPQQVADGVRADVAAIRAWEPHAGILLLGLLPRGLDAHNPMRRAIPVVNRLLAPLTALGHLRFVNVDRAFLHPDGNLRIRLLPDTVHPSALGYQLIVNHIRSALRALLGRKVP